MSDLIKRLFRSVSAAVVEKTISTTALKYTLSKIKDKFALKSEAVKNIAANGRSITVTKADGTSSTFQTQDTVYVHPSMHSASIIEQDGTHRFVTDAEKTLWNNKLNASLKGVANGVASLDANGMVPSSQLPSYVDDVLEYTNKAGFPSTGETGKIYIDKTTNITYRWGGTAYVEISPSLALGETSSTAYPGNKGKTTTDNVNAILAGTKIVPKATDANTLDGKDSTNFASAADLAKKLDKSGGTMEGDFNIDALYFKINTASGYKQAFGTVRGGLLALGSDELPAALYGYDKNQKPQWVYKEGTSYVFKDLALKDDIYPVGAIYMSVSPTSPASLFGGTWERIKGYTPAGINEEDKDTNVKTSFNQSAGKTIGSKWLQRHTHQQYVTSNDGGQAIRKDYVSDGNSQIYPQCQTGNTGDGDAQNIQPTILVYMWKRVS